MEIFNFGNFLFCLLCLFVPHFTLVYFWDCHYTYSRPSDFVPRVSEHLLIFFRFPSLSVKCLKTSLFSLVAPGLCGCVRTLTGWGEWRPLLTATHRLLTAVASRVVEHRLQACEAPGCLGSAVAVCRLSCSAARRTSPDRGGTRVPSVGGQIPIH